MPAIFISYRRDDTPGYAGRLYDRIRQEFGRDNVFIDVDALQPGDDFVDAIREKLEKCDLMLAVIGRRWLTATDDQGRLRLEDEGDYVRIELLTALEHRIRTIPALVERAAMPRLQELPEPLRPLARRQAIELSDTRWEYDVGTLVEHLKRASAGQAATAKPTAVPVPSDARSSGKTSGAEPDSLPPQPLDAERLRNEDEVASRRAQEEEHRRLETAAARAREGGQERQDAEATADASRDRAAEEKKTVATAKAAQKRAAKEERQRLARVAAERTQADQRQVEAEPSIDRDRKADQHRKASDRVVQHELEEQADKTWTPAVVTLSVGAFVAAIASAAGTPFSNALNALTTLLLLAIAIARWQASRRYGLLIVVGFGMLTIADALMWAASPLTPENVQTVTTIDGALRLGAYGCWIAALIRRGTVRISPAILPYAAIALMVAFVQWGRMRAEAISITTPILTLGTLARTTMAWSALQLWRGSRSPGSLWAVWGTTVYLSANVWLWVMFAVVPDGQFGRGPWAAFSIVTDVGAWLIVMSMRCRESPSEQKVVATVNEKEPEPN